MLFLEALARPTEEAVGGQLRQVLRANAHVQRAYLARVEFQPGSAAVALCIAYADLRRENVSAMIGDLFAAASHPRAFREIVFVTAAQERRLRNVCSAFYDRAT